MIIMNFIQEIKHEVIDRLCIVSYQLIEIGVFGFFIELLSE